MPLLDQQMMPKILLLKTGAFWMAPEQLQARTNIGAVASADIGDTSTDFVAIFEAQLIA